MYAPFVLALALSLSVTAVELGWSSGSIGATDSKCYICPNFKKLSAGTTFLIFPKNEDVGKISKIQEGDGFRCRYDSTKYWDSRNKKWLAPNYLGRCRYNSDGSRGHDSRGECPRQAPIDSKCAKDTEDAAFKARYFKPCKEKGCAQETAMCYTCPVDKGADHVNVDTRNDKLQCDYFKGPQRLNTCQYEPAKGQLTNKGPKCIAKAALDATCEYNRRRKIADEERQAHERKAAAERNTAADAKAKNDEQYDDNKSVLAHLCEGFVKKYTQEVKYLSPSTYDRVVKEGRLSEDICRNPDTALDTLAGFKFFAVTKYGRKLRDDLIKAGFKYSTNAS
ncbi:hypothetical protein GALMADRAFT_146553 [Galerina marginata CBS 339.88]|uniref:Uncharacterized protein n=1 Tax=Galerina marginata (strain CBS 339.88) TaxID=685588 RepID=A0A067SDI7_GALM3|nr:hypothetical protein GALMADRAFT_146553 [Galerina marginata CBS 339.88]